MFQSLANWKILNEGGAAIPESKRLNWEESQATYSWVKNNVIPLLGLNPEDAETIGSYGKKIEGSDYGDLDLIIHGQKLAEINNIDVEDILPFIERIL